MHDNEKRLIRQLPSRDYEAGYDDGIHDRMPPDDISEDYRLGFGDGQDMLFGPNGDGSGMDEE